MTAENLVWEAGAYHSAASQNYRELELLEKCIHTLADGYYAIDKLVYIKEKRFYILECAYFKLFVGHKDHPTEFGWLSSGENSKHQYRVYVEQRQWLLQRARTNPEVQVSQTEKAITALYFIDDSFIPAKKVDPRELSLDNTQF